MPLQLFLRLKPPVVFLFAELRSSCRSLVGRIQRLLLRQPSRVEGPAVWGYIGAQEVPGGPQLQEFQVVHGGNSLWHHRPLPSAAQKCWVGRSKYQPILRYQNVYIWTRCLKEGREGKGAHGSRECVQKCWTRYRLVVYTTLLPNHQSCPDHEATLPPPSCYAHGCRWDIPISGTHRVPVLATSSVTAALIPRVIALGSAVPWVFTAPHIRPPSTQSSSGPNPPWAPAGYCRDQCSAVHIALVRWTGQRE